jgi:hypothetical protein
MTTLGGGAIAAYLSKDGVNKLLGPTAEYLGNGIKEFTARRFKNIETIFTIAQNRLRENLDKPGAVSPKVLSKIVNDGSYSDDPLTMEYLGGVLACSRTETGRDDRGATFVQLVTSLSTYQIRAHFLIYGTIRELFKSQDYKFNMHDRPKMQIFMSFNNFHSAMDFSQAEWSDSEGMLNHILFGLTKEDLIGPAFIYGTKVNLIENGYPGAPADGIVVQPSALGVQLYMWCCGFKDQPMNHLLTGNFELGFNSVPNSVFGSLQLPA